MQIKIFVTVVLLLTAGFSFAQSAKQLNQQAEEIINDDPEKSLAIAKKALQKAQEEKDREQEAAAWLNVGAGMYYLDDYDGGITTIEKGLKIAKETGNTDIEGKCEGMIGEIYVYEAKYSQSLTHLSRARNIFENNGNTKDLARCNNSMGIIHKNQYNLNEALKYFKKGFELGDDIRKGDASLAMGEVYILQKKFTDADEALKAAVEFARKNNDKYVLADAYMSLGEVNIAFGKKAQALNYLNDALSIKEDVDDQQGISKVCVIMGNLFMSTGEPQKAHDLFLRAVDIARDINTREELKDAYLGLSNTYHQKREDDSAYMYLDKYNKLNEEILSEEASKKLSQIEESLAAAKREQEEKHRRQQEEYDRFINRVFIGVAIGIILIIGIFGYIMYKRYREKQKANIEITRQKEEVEKQKAHAEQQKLIIEEKNHEITDSINYAKRIQQAVLPAHAEFHQTFKDSFVLFKPKDIVSGDFYWFTKLRPALSGRRADSNRQVSDGDKEYVIYATADCTGHGVPGGFMSMLGTSFLNEIINEGKVFEPARALNQLRDKIINGLKQTGAAGENKDGMDIVLTVYDLSSNTLNYAAANNGFYLIRNGELIEYAADKQPIGYYGDAMKPFTLHTIELQPGDCIYTFTDGYADQFGGPKGKKLKYKTMEQKLLEIHQLPMKEQQQIMDKMIVDWMGDIEQNDDICLIGVRI